MTSVAFRESKKMGKGCRLVAEKKRKEKKTWPGFSSQVVVVVVVVIGTLSVSNNSKRDVHNIRFQLFLLEAFLFIFKDVSKWPRH